MKIAYPTMPFDRHITAGRAMMCSILALAVGNKQDTGDVEYGKICHIYFPAQHLRPIMQRSALAAHSWPRNRSSRIGGRHHDQTKAGPAPQTVQRSLLRILDGRRYHEKWRAPRRPDS